MVHVKLFEEFNSYSAINFAKKLKIYAEASDVVESVSSIEEDSGKLSFSISTNLPGDKFKGRKFFVVVIPMNKTSDVSVETFVDNKSEIKVSLEPKGENDINEILMNFIEACSLYNDAVIEMIVDAYNKINSPADIKKLII